MSELAVVAGTGTEVGKTWCTARLVTALSERGVRAVARKPAQSFQPGSGPTDAHVLGAASGEDPHVVCPAHRWYEAPLAPPMAAQLLHRPEPRLSDLVRELRADADIVLVEGAGGLRSPLAADGDTADLARSLGASRIILVANPGLGTINEVRLACGAVADLEVLVFVNRFDTRNRVHRLNRDWLRHHDGFDVHTTIETVAESLLARTAVEVT